MVQYIIYFILYNDAMFDERMETGDHVTDDMRETDIGMPSRKTLEKMGVPWREIDRFFAEYQKNEAWRASEYERMRDEFMGSSVEIVS